MQKIYIVRLTNEERTTGRFVSLPTKLSNLKSLPRRVARRSGVLSKNKITQRKVPYDVIPPKSNGEFVARMEQVLDMYTFTYSLKILDFVMNEQPVQLFKEVRASIPATRHHARRVDYESERAGVASVFMLISPLERWHRVSVRERRTKVDRAHEVKHLYPKRFKGLLPCIAELEKPLQCCKNNSNAPTPDKGRAKIKWVQHKSGAA